MKELFSLFLVFGKIGLFTLGGGYAAVCNATNDVYATGANTANGDYYYDNDERDECGRSDVTWF